MIRPACLDDRAPAYALMRELGYEETSADAFDRAFGDALIRDDLTVFVSVGDDGSLRGLAAVSERPQLHLGGTLVSLDTLVVGARFRGQGIGEELLSAVKDLARRRGARRLELSTTRTRESYRRGFYAKHGFFEVNSAVLRHEADDA